VRNATFAEVDRGAILSFEIESCGPGELIYDS
jgi:hypothetical protein